MRKETRFISSGKSKDKNRSAAESAKGQEPHRGPIGVGVLVTQAVRPAWESEHCEQAHWGIQSRVSSGRNTSQRSQGPLCLRAPTFSKPRDALSVSGSSLIPSS